MRVKRWNSMRPSHCPNCFTATNHEWWPSSMYVYVCCNCRRAFARFPALAFALPAITCKDAGTTACPHTFHAPDDHGDDESILERSHGVAYEDLTEEEKKFLARQERVEHEQRMQDPGFAAGWNRMTNLLNAHTALQSILTATVIAENSNEDTMSIRFLRSLMRSCEVPVEKELQRIREGLEKAADKTPTQEIPVPEEDERD